MHYFARVWGCLWGGATQDWELLLHGLTTGPSLTCGEISTADWNWLSDMV